MPIKASTPVEPDRFRRCFLGTLHELLLGSVQFTQCLLQGLPQLGLGRCLGSPRNGDADVTATVEVPAMTPLSCRLASSEAILQLRDREFAFDEIDGRLPLFGRILHRGQQVPCRCVDATRIDLRLDGLGKLEKELRVAKRRLADPQPLRSLGHTALKGDGFGVLRGTTSRWPLRLEPFVTKTKFQKFGLRQILAVQEAGNSRLPHFACGKEAPIAGDGCASTVSSRNQDDRFLDTVLLDAGPELLVLLLVPGLSGSSAIVLVQIDEIDRNLDHDEWIEIPIENETVPCHGTSSVVVVCDSVTEVVTLLRRVKCVKKVMNLSFDRQISHLPQETTYPLRKVEI